MMGFRLQPRPAPFVSLGVMQRSAPSVTPWPAFVSMGVWVVACLAGARAPAQDFQHDLVPFLDKYCYECHGGQKTKGDLDLKAVKDDSRFFRDQRVWREVINQVVAGEMPPAKKTVRPSPAEIEQLETNVRKLLSQAVAQAKVDPGSVTIRRLNRTEFNNTIRDLCYLDSNFSVDFPADDSGYGFDNIGDVLSFSPVHLERFIAVGQQIAAKALPLTPPEPDGTGVAMVEMTPRGKTTEQTRFFNPDPAMSGYMEVPSDAEYLLSVRLKPTGAAGDPPPKIAFAIDGAEVGVQTMKTVTKSEALEVKVKLAHGKHLFTMTWQNAPPNLASAKRTLSGYRLFLRGPLDTRTEMQRRLATLTDGKVGEARARLIVNWFVSRAFRRPATAGEITRYIKVFTTAEQAAGGTWEAGAQVMIGVVLASPKFIFRAEQDEQPTAADAHAVGEFALASRLSYFLWGSMPDEELFNLAYAKKLSASLEAQAQRMLQDPRSQYLVTGFGLQWLQVRRLATVSVDVSMFPEFNEALRAAMMKETELFLGEIVSRDRSVLDIIDADFTYVNRTLADFYKIKSSAFSRGRDKGEFVRVQLPPGDRGGVLTQASILTATSNPTRTSPVKRGKWILEQILGAPPPPAPADIPALESQHQLTGTLRQRMEQHRQNPSCASCHTRMDALGFAFEKFDAVGQVRTQDEGKPIDPSGKLPDGRAFTGAAQLKTFLKADQDKFVRNLSSKLLIYALGRGVEYYDEPAIDKIASLAKKGENRFSALAVAVVLSDPFRLRRGTSQVETVSNKPKTK